LCRGAGLRCPPGSRAGQDPLWDDEAYCSTGRSAGTRRVLIAVHGEVCMAQFQGKVAVVTGGSRGIGRAIALAFGRAGARVVVTCTRQREAAEEVVAALQQMGSAGQVCQFDVADYAATMAAFDDIVQTFGRIDILVSNAG